MGMKTMAVIMMVFVFPCLVLANELQQGLFSQLTISENTAASWVDFEVNSPDGKYVARIKALSNQQAVPAYKKAYTLIVSKIADGNNQWFWQCNYDYDGYPSGMLANDGSTFVYVSKYYNKKKPMVKIYRLGSKIALLYSSSFNISPANLKTDNNGKLWFDQDSLGCQFVYRARMPPLLEITTIDKRKYYISLDSGRILPN
ncbi:MAG: hypothetical protein ABIH18_05710 [Candidatus Omnitrophota bacterium]